MFHARVGVKGFAGHPGKPLPIVRTLHVVVRRTHADAKALREIARVTDGWLANLAGQDSLRRLELSGTAVTSAGLSREPR